MIVIKLIGLAGWDMPTHYDGQYLESYDPDRNAFEGAIVVTRNKADAMRFADVKQALAFWKQQSRTLPLRPDGEPNRPLTAFSVTFEGAKA